jgi:hypothetical protein
VARDEIKHGRFASPIGADNTGNLAFGNMQIDVVDSNKAVKRFCKLFHA